MNTGLYRWRFDPIVRTKLFTSPARWTRGWLFRLQRLLELGRVAAAGLVEHGHTDAHSGIGGGVFRCGIHPASAVRGGFQCLPLFDLFPIAFAQGTAHRDINFFSVISVCSVVGSPSEFSASARRSDAYNQGYVRLHHPRYLERGGASPPLPLHAFATDPKGLRSHRRR